MGGVNNNSLYTGYGLTRLDLYITDDGALVLSSNGKSESAADLSTEIAGSDDLAFNSQRDQTVPLPNKDNDYTGVTDLHNGTFLLNNSNVLGNTHELYLATETELDMNGHNRTVGMPSGSTNSLLSLNGDNLTVTSGGTSTDSLTGGEELNIQGDTLDITSDNSNLTANVSIANSANVLVSHVQGLGNANIGNNGTPALNNNAKKRAAASVNYILGSNLTNSGTLMTGMLGQQAGNVLTVKGNYRGNNGQLVVNMVLNGDDPVTDKLVVEDDTSGMTAITMSNAGGTGAKALNSIELIHVGGKSEGEFVQADRIVVGVYDYILACGQGANSGNWCLTSGNGSPELQPESDPMPNPEPSPDPEPNPNPTPTLGPDLNADNGPRLETGSYIVNLAAANIMFTTHLYERLGNTYYTDMVTGEQKRIIIWMRHEGGHNKRHDGSGQLRIQSNHYVLQLGGDVAQRSQNGSDSQYAGVMARYDSNDSKATSSRTGYRAEANVNGYNTGLYATRHADDESRNDACLDNWVQYSWFNNTVKGGDLQSKSYRLEGFTASLGAGYKHKLAKSSDSQGARNKWHVQP